MGSYIIAITCNSYTTDKGIECFSSANLMDEHHHPKAYQGNYYTYQTYSKEN
jgi:hypothetical protein